MKEKRAKLREKKKKENDKLAQKQERLRLLDEQNGKKRNPRIHQHHDNPGENFCIDLVPDASLPDSQACHASS